MSRHYGQLCAAATALDLVGERWTLLVVRELLDGPAHYRDLRNGVPGIPTDVLAQRLRSLEHAGLILRQPDPGDGRRYLYQLTPTGRDLEPVLIALARFGFSQLSRQHHEAQFRLAWLGLALRARFRAERMSSELVIRFTHASDAAQFRLTPAGVFRDDEAQPQVTADGSPHALFAAIGSPRILAELVERGELRLTGSLASLRILSRVLTGPPPRE
jgi:DNA-binding HxlR family transcriptional regulator